MNEQSLLLPIHSSKSYYTEAADTAETDNTAAATSSSNGCTVKAQTTSKETRGDCGKHGSTSRSTPVHSSQWTPYSGFSFMVLLRAVATVSVATATTAVAVVVVVTSATWARISRRTLTTTPSFLSASFLPKSQPRRQKFSHWKTTAKGMSTESSNEALNVPQKGWLSDWSLSDFLKDSRDRLEQVATADSAVNTDENNEPRRLHFVIGNEAGDADSLVSALSWAFLENSRHSYCHVDDCDDPITTMSKWKIPLVSISQADLETQRPETLLLLQLAGITPTELLYIDNDNLQHVLEENDNDDDDENTSTYTKVYLTLMDHNRLSTQSPFANNPKTTTVLEIVDHHYDEGLYVDTTLQSLGGLRLVAFENGQALVASTCTMVVERIVEHCCNDNALKSNRPDDAIIIPAPLSILLLGAILLDTINLNVAAGKVTDRDVAAVQVLLQHTDWTNLFNADASKSIKSSAAIQLDPINQQPDTTVLFNALQNAKFAPSFWQSLSVRDALRLDYKRFAPPTAINDDDSRVMEAAAFGISTVLMPWTDFYQKNAFDDGVRDFMQEMNVDLFGIMLAYVESDGDGDDTGGGGRLHRELVLASLELETSVVVSLDAMVDFLLTHDNNPLDLSEQLPCQDSESSEVNSSGGSGSMRLAWRCFTQRNAKASRKQVAPAMLKYFDQS